MRMRPLAWTSGILLLAGTYYLAGMLGLSLAFFHSSVSPVWPPTGLAIAALLIFGSRYWPGVALGAFAVNLATTGHVPSSLGIAVGNTLEALFGAWLATRFAAGKDAFERGGSVFRFFGLCGAVAPIASATIGVLCIEQSKLATWADFGRLWTTWWLGDAVGAVILAPLLLLWYRNRKWEFQNNVEAALLGLTTFLTAWTVFDFFSSGSKHYPLTFLYFLPILWAAFRFDARVTSTVVIVQSTMAVLGTVNGYGPFVPLGPNEALIVLQAFLGISSVVGLALATTVQERLRLIAEIEGSHFDLERKVKDRTVELTIFNLALRREIQDRSRAEERYRAVTETANEAIITADGRGVICSFNPAAERIFGYTGDEVLGQPLTLLMPERFYDPHKKGLDRFSSTGAGDLVGKTIELAARRKDGTEFPMEISLATWRAEEEIFFTGILRDITRRRLAEERFRHLLNAAPDAMVIANQQGEIALVNVQTEKLFGYLRDELLGKKVGMLFPERGQELFDNPRSRAMGEGLELLGRRKDGTEFPIDISLSPLEIEGGRLVTASIRDISQRKRAEQERRDNEILKMQVDELAHGARELSTLNEMGEILRAAETLDEACPILPRFLRELFPSDSGALYVVRSSKDLLESAARWGESPPVEELLHPNECWSLRRGEVHRVECIDEGIVCKHVKPPLIGTSLCVPIVARGETVGMLHLLEQDGHRATSFEAENARPAEYKERLAKAAAQQIGLALLNVRLRETLRAQATRDSLTGLFNRRYLEEAFTREFHRASRRKGKLGLLMIDIDHFKKFNDRFGHAAGDMALRDLAIFLRSHSRAEEILCRHGGEEFVLLLVDCSVKDAVKRAEQIRIAVKKQSWDFEGRPLGMVTVSIGVAFIPDHAGGLEDLLRAADAALYQAKKEGRDRIILPPPAQVITDSQAE